MLPIPPLTRIHMHLHLHKPRTCCVRRCWTACRRRCGARGGKRSGCERCARACAPRRCAAEPAPNAPASSPSCRRNCVTCGRQSLLRLLPRSVNATNADGTPGLNLSGYAKNQFPFVATALSTDNELGAAVATSMTIYNTPGLASSGINVAASQQQAAACRSRHCASAERGARGRRARIRRSWWTRAAL